ncbi:MAG TPA: GntR family transcriptional regulator [Bacillales bacterium]|nr:GntR family transcriptional regulator [Bacillales bacterium]
MIINQDGTTPIYVQIAQWLETEILAGNIKTNEKIYSQYQLAEMFNINPATAAKGLNLLADDHIVYKKRGLGMFVTEHAQAIILTKRKEKILKKLVQELVAEAKRLHVSQGELIEMIKSTCEQGDD